MDRYQLIGSPHFAEYVFSSDTKRASFRGVTNPKSVEALGLFGICDRNNLIIKYTLGSILPQKSEDLLVFGFLSLWTDSKD